MSLPYEGKAMGTLYLNDRPNDGSVGYIHRGLDYNLGNQVLEKFQATNVSRPICGAVIMSLFQNQQWAHIACDEKIYKIAFLCESDNVLTEEKLLVHSSTIFNSSFCGKSYILYNHICIAFNSTGRNLSTRQLSLSHNLHDNTFNMYLSKWSLGKSNVVNFNKCNGAENEGMWHSDIKFWRASYGRCSFYKIITQQLEQGAHINNYIYLHLFKCSDNSFILRRYYCDGVADCKDMSDESSCSHIYPCAAPNCSRGGCNMTTCNCHVLHFKCGSGECVTYNFLCDGIQHCRDGSDEIACVLVSLRIANSKN